MTMKKFKKSLALLFVALLLVPMFTACSSYDENYAIYELWVAGVKVTTRNQADILGDGTVSFVGEAPQFDDITMLSLKYNGEGDA